MNMIEHSFRGLAGSDFSRRVTGTHWRSREQLGGSVTRLLDVAEPWNSWAIPRRPQVHWAAESHRRRGHSFYQTKYLAQLDQNELVFGLYLERSNEVSDPQDDWMAFLRWLDDPANSRWLQKTALQEGAAIRDPFAEPDRPAFLEPLTAVEHDFVCTREKKTVVIRTAELSGFLRKNIPDGKWLNLLVCRTMNRSEAVAAGQAVAATIAHFFNALLPAYWSGRAS